MPESLPSHASPVIAPVAARPSAQYLTSWADLENTSQPSTPGIPPNLISPAYTPPLTPSISSPGTPGGHHHSHSRHEPKSIPVDTSLDIHDPSIKQPRLLPTLPKVECLVRARIPTTSGAEMFLHLYSNDSDNKEHLAIVFGDQIRSRSLDAEKPDETEWDRMMRGAYVGRLRPGRTSSRRDDEEDLRRKVLKRPENKGRKRSGSALKNVETIPEGNDSSIKTGMDVEAHTETQTQIQEEIQIPEPSSSPSSSQKPEPLDSISPNTITTTATQPPLVRIHSECYTGETAWSARCDCGEQLDEAARLMSTTSPLNPSHHPGGVIVYLRQEGRGIGLASKLKAYNLQDLGSDTVEANLLLRHPADARSYGLATAILVDLGLGTDMEGEEVEQDEMQGQTGAGGTSSVPAKKPRGIRLLTNNPDKVRAVEGPSREVRVVERVAMVPIAWRTHGQKGVKGEELSRYLETKIGRMGHMIHDP